MKAAYIETTGSPDVIQYGDLPRPSPTGTEVLIKVAAAAVNPVDTYVRSGMVAMDLPKPYIIGCDLAGAVQQLGPDAKQFAPGDRVWGTNQGLLGRQGTSAEYACVEEQWLYPTPANVADSDAAAVSLVGITAHLGLFRCAGLGERETVFVNGGTGGVGSMVVQMAKALGARVITTVGSAEKAQLCKSRGADLVLNYKNDDIPQAVKQFTQDQGVDVWYETQREPDFVRSVELIRKRGRLIVMAGRDARPTFPVGPFYVKDLNLYGFAMFNATPEEQRRCAEDINRWLESGQLKVSIGQTFPLSQAADAHRLQEQNTLNKAGTLTGKIILRP